MEVYSGSTTVSDIWVIFFPRKVKGEISLQIRFRRKRGNSWQEDWKSRIENKECGVMLCPEDTSLVDLEYVEEIPAEEIFSGMRLELPKAGIFHSFGQGDTDVADKVLTSILDRRSPEVYTFSLTPLEPGPIFRSQRKIVEAIQKIETMVHTWEERPWLI